MSKPAENEGEDASADGLGEWEEVGVSNRRLSFSFAARVDILFMGNVETGDQH